MNLFVVIWESSENKSSLEKVAEIEKKYLRTSIYLYISLSHLKANEKHVSFVHSMNSDLDSFERHVGWCSKIYDTTSSEMVQILNNCVHNSTMHFNSVSIGFKPEPSGIYILFGKTPRTWWIVWLLRWSLLLLTIWASFPSLGSTEYSSWHIISVAYMKGLRLGLNVLLEEISGLRIQNKSEMLTKYPDEDAITWKNRNF